MQRLTTLLVFLPLLLLAEGTKQLQPNADDYGFINLMDQQNNLGTERTFALYNSPKETKLNIRIKNPSTEIICFGIKTVGSAPLFYRIIAPNGTVFINETLVPQVITQNGYIANYNEAVTGPKSINPSGYTPITFTPTMVGDYSIEFRDPTHNPPTVYAQRKLELFDITVINTITNTAIEGRLWSKAWDITTQSATNPFNGSAYIYTNDGITTQVQFEQFEAWSFIIQSNKNGPGTSGDILADRKSINGGLLLPDYKIFLTKPDPTEFPTSATPSITGVPKIDLCAPTTNYCIDLNVSNPGVVEYVIDIDGSVGYDSPRDVKLTTETIAGANCLPWNGLDGLGNPIAATDTFDILISYQAGVTHLFIHDAENNPKGFSVKHIAPTTGLSDPLLYYDDSSPSVNGATSLTGCATNCHSWAGNFGNNKTINTWWVTFFENDTIKDLTFNKSLLKAAVDISVITPLSCDGENLQLAPLNTINGGTNPVYSWWINTDSISSGNSFSPTTLTDGDNIRLIIHPAEICTITDTAFIKIMVPKTPTVPNDTTLCVGETTSLTAISTNGFFRWKLNDTIFSLEKTITITADSTKTYTAETSFIQPTANLIQNANFEEGRTKFGTEYTYRGAPPVLLGPGFYTLGTSGEDGFAGAFYNIPDHTSGKGLMLIVDGNTVNGSVVYKTTVPVVTGLDYNFSAWVVNVHKTSTNAPSLQFYINNQPLGEFDVDLTPQWTQFNTFWKANTTGNVEIKIVNKVTAAGGNDFALDDLVFGPINTCTNDVTVTVKQPLQAEAKIKKTATICEGDSVKYQIIDTLHLGNSPSYIWLLNGVTQTTSNNNITFIAPNNNDTVQLITTSSLVDCIFPTDRDTSVITVNPLPIFTVSGNLFVCDGDTAMLNMNISSPSGSYTYQWLPSTFLDVNNTSQVIAKPSVTTNYSTIVTDSKNCSDTVDVTITVHPKPTVTLLSTAICEGDTATITATTNATGTVNYNWSPTTAVIQNNTSSILVNPTSLTDYQLIITDANTCSDTASIQLQVYEKPNVTIQGEDVCNGSAATLNTKVINGSAPYNYDWFPNTNLSSTNTASISATPSSTTIYNAIVTDSKGCKDTSTTTVGVTTLPRAQLLQNDTIICLGERIYLTAYSEVDYQIKWLYSNNNTDFATVGTGNSFTANQSGAYKVEVSNNGFCPVISTPLFIKQELVSISISASALESYNDSPITLSAATSTQVKTMEWIAPVTNYTENRITFIPSKTNTYTVTGKGDKCEVSDTITILVYPKIIIPNGFSPNGDNMNEAWFIKGIDAYTNAEVYIYNRWGSEVYHYKKGYTTPWEGKNEQGEDLPVATYYYTIYLHDAIEQSFQGSISILR